MVCKPLTLISRLLASAVVVLAGCASPLPRGADESAPVAACQRWLQQLDEQTDAHAVRDGGAARIDGVPFLRVDRLLASFRDESMQDAARWRAWGERLLALDQVARRAEIRNLPPTSLQALGAADREDLDARAKACGPVLWQALSADEAARQRLRDAAVVPDDYSAALRTLGLYPLSRWPFFAGVERELRHWQSRWMALPPAEAPGWVRYRPAGETTPPVPWTPLPVDALGIPAPDADTARRVLQAYAPVLHIETRSDADRPGRLRWGQGPAPEVQTQQPVLYQRIAHTRYGDRVLLQLVYSLWFPERPARHGLDLLAGRVDAVVLRLTLDERGRPLMLDSIHGCGCYHVFVPARSVDLRPPPSARIEWAFVPAALPELAPGQRLRVYLSASDHQLVGVAADDGAGQGTALRLEDEDQLRSLPTPAGGHRSAFWSSGIMPGTERGERALFWPMGIESPGAMRQWGRHPTAFVGRRHFDEPRLLEQRFHWRQEAAAP
ncbi:hypothetical protein [Hydrogenophaga luteola]|uniref:Uncharacterized protein n=1 Tax=Hydrogenophaga luteola TaxID=1591122 RepID=A0ABV7W3Z9_9BURK